MGNVSGEICRENQNTHFVFNNIIFFKSWFCEIMWENILEPGRTQMISWRVRIACWIPKSTNTQSPYVIHFCFSTAAVVTHKRLEVTLYVHWLSCYIISLSCLQSSNEHRRKEIFSCVYQFNLSITVRQLPNNMKQNPVWKPSTLAVGQEPPFMQPEISCRFHKSPQLIPTFRCTNPALFLSRTCFECARRFQAVCVRRLRRVLRTACR
jgi:hypothetical protein